MLQKFLKRSWVRGRGGLISFSIAIAMDCASFVPITMGSFLSPSDSLTIKAYAPCYVWLYEIPLICNSMRFIVMSLRI